MRKLFQLRRLPLKGTRMPAMACLQAPIASAKLRTIYRESPIMSYGKKRVSAIIAGLTKPQQRHLRQACNGYLSKVATTRCILITQYWLTDYSFRPARLTPLGRAVRKALTTSKEPNP